MAQLRKDYLEFEKRHIRIVVIGPEDDKTFEKFWREYDLPFIGLPDPQANVLKLYGQEINVFKLGRMPAQVLVDRSGMIRYAHYGRAMSDIPENDEILAFVDQLDVPIGEK